MDKKDLIPIQQIFTPTGVGLSRPKQGVSPCRIVKRCLTRSMEVKMEDIKIEDITIEDMPNEDMKLTAEMCGLHVAIALLKGMGGVTLNVPSRGFIGIVAKRIIEEWNGENLKRLCIKFGVTEAFARKVIRESYKCN